MLVEKMGTLKPTRCLILVFMLAGCARAGYVDRDPGALKSPPADLSLRALFLGNYFTAYNYFERADKHPFDPNDEGFNARDACWCAEASLLAYVPDEAFVRT